MCLPENATSVCAGSSCQTLRPAAAASLYVVMLLPPLRTNLSGSVCACTYGTGTFVVFLFSILAFPFLFIIISVAEGHRLSPGAHCAARSSHLVLSAASLPSKRHESAMSLL